MSRNDYPSAQWRKSHYSNGQAECVEVARNLPGIAVRDSKDPDGPWLAFRREQWRAFAAKVKAGSLFKTEFKRPGGAAPVPGRHARPGRSRV